MYKFVLYIGSCVTGSLSVCLCFYLSVYVDVLKTNALETLSLCLCVCLVVFKHWKFKKQFTRSVVFGITSRSVLQDSIPTAPTLMTDECATWRKKSGRFAMWLPFFKYDCSIASELAAIPLVMNCCPRVNYVQLHVRQCLFGAFFHWGWRVLEIPLRLSYTSVIG